MRRRTIRGALEQRSAAAAAPDTWHPKYIATIDAMIAVLRAWLADGRERPAFALPAPEILFAATLDQAPRICRNAAAQELSALFCEAGRQFSPNGEPTILMLRVALDACGVEPESVTLGELGFVPLGDGSGAWRPS